jgi:hypothetical protein
MVPTFSNTLIVAPVSWALCVSEKQFRKLLKRIDLARDLWPAFVNPNAHATAHFLERGDRGLAIVCIVPDKSRTREQVHALIAHEAVHVWQDVRRRIGEKEPSSEFEAYAVQSIVQDLLCDYREGMKRRRR